MRHERRALAAVAIVAAMALGGCAGGPSSSARQTESPTTSPIAQRAINSAQAMLGRGDLKGALTQAEQAIEADPRSASARIAYGTVLEALGRGAEAGPQFKKAFDLSPRTGLVLNAYGAWLCRNSRFDEALKAFSDATLDGAYREPEVALGNAGACAAQAERLTLAELNFRAALEIAPAHAPSLVGMSRLEHKRGNPLRARAFLQRREALGPLGLQEIMLAIEIETAAGDARAAARYRAQMADLARSAEAVPSSTERGSPRQ